MEVFNPTIPNDPQLLSRISIFSPKSSFTTWRKKNPSRFTIPTSKIPLYPHFPLSIPLPNSKKFQISAHFCKPTNRRNSLREKLTQQQQQKQQQVSQNPIFYDPNSEFHNPLHKFDIDNNNNTSSFSKLESLGDFDNVVEDIVDSKESKLQSLGDSGNVGNVKELKLESLGDSALLNRLESWVDQYKADSEFWGVGSGPIFTVFQNSEGKIKRVVVNEDEILRRSEIEPSLYEKSELEGLTEVKSKISHARFLARETEVGNCLIPKSSSVAKFVVSGEKSGFVNAIRGLTLQRGLFSRFSRVGITVLCGFFVFWALKRSFSGGENKEEYSNLEKEMMRRKMKARMERQKLVERSVEVIQNSKAPQIVSIDRPQIDKQDLMDTIFKAKASNDQLTLQASSSGQDIKSTELDNKIQEIRAMARRARELEKKDALLDDSDEDYDQTIDKLPFEKKGIVSSKIGGLNGSIKSIDDPTSDDTRFDSEVAMIENSDTQNSDISEVEVTNDSDNTTQNVKDSEYILELSDTSKNSNEVSQSSKSPQTQSRELKKNSDKAKPRVIRSVKEAREYLSQKLNKQEKKQEPHVRNFQEGDTILCVRGKKGSDGNISQGLDKNESVPAKNIGPESVEILHLPYEDDKKIHPLTLVEKSDSTSAENAFKDSTFKTKGTVPTKNNEDQIPMPSLDLGSSGRISEAPTPNVVKENWVEKNFHEFDPIIKKIGVGFQDNYMVAKEKVNQELNLDTEMIRPNSDEDDGELDWMKDDKLREIVFQVRENELMGRDPFYLMDAEDKVAFFEGLEKKVEKQNEKLQNLHQWVHSNVENLDYGADGISVHDPPEKVIPRWKGPPVNTSPEFLDDYLEQRKALITESSRNPSHEITPTTSVESLEETKPQGGDLKTSKIIIEGSDGSVRVGKKSGKEFWQHTKKWSRGFVESYNAESDPEIKEVMKDMGKDLDRWITKKEVEEAADIMNKIPEKGRKFIDEKLNKVKREMELFGPQAVMSKYSEYAEEKEEDYLWWLDLPVVLCIELYTNQEGDQNIGFYSLEMAADLELDPKPYHVIAFEDAGDCKNLCYIIQAHMEMLGNGNAFVVAQPPKDCFREAKANGFNVTVIRKGELKLNVDQTLEEVEEQITEIGSKIYHDKIMKGRSVDISTLMKGVFGAKKPTKRKRSRRKLKKPNKR